MMVGNVSQRNGRRTPKTGEPIQHFPVNLVRAVTTHLRYFRNMALDTQREVPAAPHHPDPSRWSDDEVTLAWLGHSTVLLNFFGIWILTDPALDLRIGLRFGPITIGPKRYVEAALGPKELPPLDLVLLTHAHMDHMDLRTLSQLRPGAAAITARSTADLLAGIPFSSVTELDWNCSATPETRHGSIRVTAFEVRHWGARMRNDPHRGFNAYLLERNGRRICFAGDTAHTDLFRNIGGESGIDLIVLPIGAYNPWVASHCNPEEAVDMANQARGRFIAPVHHQTFKLSWEPMGEPIQRFCQALSSEPERIAWREIGETFRLPPTPG